MFDTAAQLGEANSTILPNGSTAFVADTRTLYRLDKSPVVLSPALGDLVVTPADQSGAKWIAEERNGGNPFHATVYLNGFATCAMSGMTWQYLGNNPASFLPGFVNPAFSVNPTTSEVTYLGPQREMKVSVKLSLFNVDGATLVNASGVVSLSGDVVVGTTTAHDSKGQMSTDVDNNIQELATERVLILSTNNTLRLAIRNPVNTDDFGIGFYQMVIGSP